MDKPIPKDNEVLMRVYATIVPAEAMLGLSRNFTYQLVREGKLPSIRFGKRILIPRIALEKMLEKGVPL